MTDTETAARALALLDLTDLSDQASEAGTLQLCARAVATPGPVAAICIWPRFVTVARQTLRDSTVQIATVVNFPAGGSNCALTAGDVAEALGDGADEIDLVLPWRAFLEGDSDIAREMVASAKDQCGDKLLKVILETGEYPDLGAVKSASELAIAAGADFIKTSTGKTARSASLPAVETMLGVIKASGKPVGIKPSGGIRTLEDASAYLDLADRIMGPDWARPATFRFGASGLHQVLVDIIEGKTAGERIDGAY
ncbi:deoxyribose-phosphate aldolase [Bosea sp. (in: a-proteobacteria)]|jgi:deoxyribose-phosphate aldolase|uniref:deoxyribose-phosphate aldolase n=1 Tax=Bosea sp. (in: a-proteobacteria) TaxID=1871050 RepID=UPI003F720B5C